MVKSLPMTTSGLSAQTGTLLHRQFTERRRQQGGRRTRAAYGTTERAHALAWARSAPLRQAFSADDLTCSLHGGWSGCVGHIHHVAGQRS
jgi:hypothetical protein